MKNLILGLLLSLIFYPQLIWADSLNNDKVQYRHLRVEYGAEEKFRYNNTVYTVYAAKCNTITTDPENLNYIVLKPGEPIELKDEKGNILILYTLPCN
jgi:hypothetical protein